MFFGKVKNTDDEWGFDVFKTAFDNPIEIDDDTHMSIIDEANNKGKLIKGDKNGQPILVDPPKPTEKEIASEKIYELENYLTTTDWYVLRSYETGISIPDDIKQKRQKVRDEISRLRLIK